MKINKDKQMNNSPEDMNCILQEARSIAIEMKNQNVFPEAILLALLRNPGSNASIILSGMIDVKSMIARLERTMKSDISSAPFPNPALNPSSLGILEFAKKEASKQSKDPNSEHFLLALASVQNTAAYILLCFYGVTADCIRAKIPFVTKPAVTPSQVSTAKTADDLVNKTINTINSVVNSVSDGIKRVSQSPVKKPISREEWVKILYEAIKTSNDTGMSVPACFIEICSKVSVADRVAYEQARKEMVNDLVEDLLNA